MVSVVNTYCLDDSSTHPPSRPLLIAPDHLELTWIGLERPSWVCPHLTQIVIRNGQIHREQEARRPSASPICHLIKSSITGVIFISCCCFPLAVAQGNGGPLTGSSAYAAQMNYSHTTYAAEASHVTASCVRTLRTILLK